MAEMDGIGLLQTIQGMDPTLPVLLLSGAPDLETAMKAVQLGAFEYLPKPFQIDRILESAARAVAQCRARRAEREDLRLFRSGARARKASPAAFTAEMQPGAIVGGNYRLVRQLGAGGMGLVFEAVREDLAGMKVALKVLHPDVQADAGHLARFRREAEAVARIRHPNIVHILDFQAPEGEPAFLVMELLEGTSLGQAINQQGRFSPARAAFVATQVLAALSAAHAAGVIHRDLKPENVFLTSISGLDVVKLLDFGIAKVQTDLAEPKLTRTGMILGTPAYMAPESARGSPVDSRADLYAAGCILYECLTGKAPFEGANYHALLYAIAHDEPRAISEICPDADPALSAIVKTALSKDPEQRFQTADAMMHALRPWVDSLVPRAEPSTPALLAFAPTVLGMQDGKGER